MLNNSCRILPKVLDFEIYNSRTWFQQLAARTTNFWVCLKQNVFIKLICRWGDIPWPRRCPALTSPNFILWGHIKRQVYSNKPARRGSPIERENSRINGCNSSRNVSWSFHIFEAMEHNSIILFWINNFPELSH